MIEYAGYPAQATLGLTDEGRISIVSEKRVHISDTYTS